VTNLSDSIESADQIDSAGGSQGVREQETAQDRTMDVLDTTGSGKRRPRNSGDRDQKL
jgi:hypothetical protein